MKAKSIAGQQGPLSVVIYPGDNKILIAMSLTRDAIDEQSKNLAGFAIWRKPQGQAETPLANRIGFDVGVSKQTTSETRVWTDSDKAPFQKFRWVDVPPDGFTVPITYRVKALYFSGQGQGLTDGPEATVTATPSQPLHSKFRPAFTRGYIASQAYADLFDNAPIRPQGPKSPDFDPKPYEKQYAWLGADARAALFAFIAECENDKTAKIDVFVYDDDDPEIIQPICRMGKEGRLRAILDNAALHTKPDKSGVVPPEVRASAEIIAAVGKDNVKQGHFGRYQHNKVFIKRGADGTAQKVLFGSMNFSIRGLYVQANNIIVVDDPKTAGMFAAAFDEAFADGVSAAKFRKNAIAKGYMAVSAADSPTLPKFSLALSPHPDANVSLGPMADRIRTATSSVLFAVMEPTGQGPVLASLRKIAAEPSVFSYGTVQTDKGLAVQSPNGAMGQITGFAALVKNVPQPFRKEYDGGPGIAIHDKFVVVDFNAANPTVFTGSSNLAAGGETLNGDSLTMIEDAAIATMYAIEAVALFDHYHFRKAMQRATAPKPLTLWYPGKPGSPDPWWKEYYDPTKIQLRDRCLFAKVPLPAGVDTTKVVDWQAVDAQAPAAKSGERAAAKKTAAKKSAGGRTAAKKSAAKKSTTKKRAPKKGPTKTSATRKTTSKKVATKRSGAKKATAKKATPKKKVPKKAAVKKAAVKKSASRKRKPAKKAAVKKRRGRG